MTKFLQATLLTLALVLAGGRGKRLKDLTKWRVKPAVPFGGKYRIIDFALSNCINSGIRRVGVGCGDGFAFAEDIGYVLVGGRSDLAILDEKRHETTPQRKRRRYTCADIAGQA